MVLQTLKIKGIDIIPKNCFTYNSVVENTILKITNNYFGLQNV